MFVSVFHQLYLHNDAQDAQSKVGIGPTFDGPLPLSMGNPRRVLRSQIPI